MIREEFGDQHEESFKKEAWDRWHEILGDTHSFMKTQFDRHAEVLQEFLKQKDTTGFWIVWSDIVEIRFAIGLGAV